MSLEEKRDNGFHRVRCKECDKVLAEFDGRDWLTRDCQHFRWKQVNTLCFHFPDAYQECDPEYMKKLKRRYILSVNKDENFLFLISRQVDEELR